MPALEVLVDREVIATVNTDGLHVVSARVFGTLVEPEFATLEMSGGVYPESGESTYLTWIHHVALLPSQLVTVRLLEGGSTYPHGKTLEELFPNEEIDRSNENKSNAEIFAELRARDLCRGRYLFRGNFAGAEFTGATASGDHGFGFDVTWNWQRPDRARVSLHAYTLENLELRTPMRYIAESKLSVGQESCISVDA